jgi:hypothetical protein
MLHGYGKRTAVLAGSAVENSLSPTSISADTTRTRSCSRKVYIRSRTAPCDVTDLGEKACSAINAAKAAIEFRKRPKNVIIHIGWQFIQRCRRRSCAAYYT